MENSSGKLDETQLSALLNALTNTFAAGCCPVGVPFPTVLTVTRASIAPGHPFATLPATFGHASESSSMPSLSASLNSKTVEYFKPSTFIRTPSCVHVYVRGPSGNVKDFGVASHPTFALNWLGVVI